MEINDLNQLRELFLSAGELSLKARFFIVSGSLALLVTVLVLVRRRALREEYTPIWVAVSVALMLLSLFPSLLLALTRLLGAWSYSATVFFLGEVFLVVICLNFAVRLSRASGQIKVLGQEIALLRARLDEAGSAHDTGGAKRAG